jgi:hypothetical protein
VTILNWYAAVLLGFAAFRTWKLAAEDAILDRPRIWVVGKMPKWFEEQLECPWCSGFWIAVAWWGAAQVWERGTVIAAAPFAISAVVGIIAWCTSD